MKIRNITIIAHVDHGKTTLTVKMLQQSNIFRQNQVVDDLAMDKNDIEKERGITIYAKCTALFWKDIKINIIDTPGHADFGGEVERILSMVDGVVLLVDSAEGPMPQTKFVLQKALQAGLRPIVVINKIDRSDTRPDVVLDEIFELFISLNATDEQLDFPVLYASGRSGWCKKNMDDKEENLQPLFETIFEHVGPPKYNEGSFAMLVTLLQYDKFLGRILVGRIYSGNAKINMPVKAINLQGKLVDQARLTKLLSFSGLECTPIEEADAGDIVAIAGMSKASVGETICDLSVHDPIPSTPIDPPTMSISIGVNSSPLAGKEGNKLTSRMIRDRLFAEAETNVAITVTESAGEMFEVGGRGELQLGILIETMRREGFELSVSQPKVLFRYDENNNKLEPIEEVIIDLDEEFSGVVMEKLSQRRGEMQDMFTLENGKTRLEFLMPSRGLIGYHGAFLTDTRGTGVLNRIFYGYDRYKGEFENRRNGALIATNSGNAIAYALYNLQERGVMFINPQDSVYTGMVVGEHNRDNDLEVNVLKAKQLTNIRASGSDDAIKLVQPRYMTLEQMMAYIASDELIEVTPMSLRLRKIYLDPNERKKMKRK